MKGVSIMKCTSCGSELAENVKFCTQCGAPVPKAPPAEPEKPLPPPVPPRYSQPSAPIPLENRPLSPWAYYGLKLLFSIPLVGFICLIVFSLDNGNIHRRNFARSYWCGLIITLALIILAIVILLVTGLSATVLSELENIAL